MMPFVEELWNNTTSSYKNWHKLIKCFSIFIKPNKCQKNRKEKQIRRKSEGERQRKGDQLGERVREGRGSTRRLQEPLPRRRKQEVAEASRARATPLFVLLAEEEEDKGEEVGWAGQMGQFWWTARVRPGKLR